MKKTVLSILLLGMAAFAFAQTGRTENAQEDPKQEKPAAKQDQQAFQNQKEVEAREKQEAKRKAMREKAKTKQEIEKSR